MGGCGCASSGSCGCGSGCTSSPNPTSCALYSSTTIGWLLQVFDAGYYFCLSVFVICTLGGLYFEYINARYLNQETTLMPLL
ncbi:hypothetical protein V495_08677 [Pseudogymnoascus sp. VKM F-4514 (FW-929)]|nr:hypothetical protein V495_08677 [Pseudogymnoascus sp. VKM F-4514 (FW-929)]KFY56639.1 hypothetical protein V497_06110 [Pseudogymnoascus sp. VKM F-4516 (FW-969)]